MDHDPRRDRLREMLVTNDTRNLQQLARSAPVNKLSAATLALLGRSTEAPPGARGAGPIGELLRRAQQRFPSDFWINETLGWVLHKLEPSRLEEAIGFYRVAVAIRPQSPGAHLQLGVALS